MERIQIGKTDLRVAPLGLGTWAWGDRAVWGWGAGYGEKDVDEAFKASIEAGVDFLDTAEIYGRGISERIVGRLTRGTPLVVATKFFPVRATPSSLPHALDESLARLDRGSVDLYQIHWPVPWMSTRALMGQLTAAVRAGKTKAVGVSNYNARQMRGAHTALVREGIPLASNQVEYSLLHRKPEANGVLDACRELGTTLIAYSPIAKGALSGKYSAANRPKGARRVMRVFRGRALDRAESLIALVRAIAQRHGRTASQVALRWLIQQGAVPIPGAKTAAQATENAGALAFTLDGGEMDELERVSRPWKK
jgi:aryl-alcohol dehydrogenase-like predicted oxidoreductase